MIQSENSLLVWNRATRKAAAMHRGLFRTAYEGRTLRENGDDASFRAALGAGVPCVLVGHAIYPKLGSRRASLEPATYELLRGLGFEGVAITDSLGVFGSPYAPYWARLALRAGADLVLTTSSRDAGRMVQALAPLAGALLERFPRLKFVSVESGIGWIPFILEGLNYAVREAGARVRTLIEGAKP